MVLNDIYKWMTYIFISNSPPLCSILTAPMKPLHRCQISCKEPTYSCQSVSHAAQWQLPSSICSTHKSRNELIPFLLSPTATVHQVLPLYLQTPENPTTSHHFLLSSSGMINNSPAFWQPLGRFYFPTDELCAMHGKDILVKHFLL